MTSLPEDVWQRLADEAAAHDQSVGKYLQVLIVARDKRKNGGA